MSHARKLPVEPRYSPVRLSDEDVLNLAEVYRDAMAEETDEDSPFPFVEPLTVRVSGGYVDLYRDGTVRDFNVLCDVSQG